MLKILAAFVVAVTGFSLSCNPGFSQDSNEAQWYRGNLHTHSLWSDGNDFPEMITQWYVDNGYHFLALTDHNVLSRGQRWMSADTIEQRAGKSAMEKYLLKFGDDWVETRERKVPVKAAKKAADAGADNSPGKSDTPASAEFETIAEVRLRGLDEFRSKFESPGKFLLIEAEEISDRAEGGPIHMNATNLKSVISPMGGKSVIEAINNNLRAAEEQAEENGEPILVHLNHPNFGWAVTAEEMAAVTNEKFFEVYNGHPGVNHLGDATRPGVEKMWDIANTIRIGELKAEPMFGLATDDSHHYHDRPGQNAKSGRGWVMVHAVDLEPVSLITAIKTGDFYCSSGVELESVQYDPATKKLSLKIKPQPDVTYKTEFVGTLRNYDKSSTAQLNADGKPVRATRVYSKDVGKVFATSDSTEPSFQLTGEELFVRAVITSSKPHPRGSFEGQLEQAWTQPVGWR